MAKKITELTELTSYATNDLLIIEDVSANTTKKITWANLIASSSITPPKWTNPYKFRVYRNAALNTVSSSFTKLAFDSESFDTNSNFASGTYTVPVSGFYQFNARLSFDHDGFIQMAIYKNGAAVSYGTIDFYDTGQASGVSVADFIQCTAADTIEVYYYCDGVKAIDVGADKAYFSGFLVTIT